MIRFVSLSIVSLAIVAWALDMGTTLIGKSLGFYETNSFYWGLSFTDLLLLAVITQGLFAVLFSILVACFAKVESTRSLRSDRMIQFSIVSVWFATLFFSQIRLLTGLYNLELITKYADIGRNLAIGEVFGLVVILAIYSVVVGVLFERRPWKWIIRSVSPTWEVAV